MIKVGSKVNIYFTHRAKYNLIVEYEPQQPGDVWILIKENGKECKIMHFDMMEEVE